MTLSYRHRAAMVMAGAVIAAAFLAGAGADAATLTVTFSGQPQIGPGTLSCPSLPSTPHLSVPEGSVVDFVNRTGKPATLWVGDSKKGLPDRSLVPVTFTQGPASIVVSMVPDCALDLGSHDNMTVQVSPQPDGVSVNSASASGGNGNAGGGNAGGGSTGGGSTSGAGNDPFTPPTTDPTIDIGRAVVPTSENHGASGLLTLVAAVGVVGVSSAAIRAIIAQRATRASAA